MNKKTLTILGIAILVVIAIGFWFVQNKKSIAPVKTEIQEETNTVVDPQVKPEDDKGEDVIANENQATSKSEEKILYNPDGTIDTSNWQIYRNEEYGFEMKLPGSLNKWNIEIKSVNREVNMYNSDNNFVVRFEYPLDEKILRSESDPSLGYITEMNVWYMDFVSADHYIDSACKINPYPKCRQGKILGQNDKYVFVSGFSNLWTPCSLDDPIREKESEFCEVDGFFSQNNTDYLIDFKTF